MSFGTNRIIFQKARLGESKVGENKVFKLASVREQRTRNLGNVRCIKDEDSKVAVEEVVIKERWPRYFCKLFNGDMLKNSLKREHGCSER